MMQKWVQRAISAVMVTVAFAAAANAEVTASIDRPSVDLNESFVLRIVVDKSTDLEPDLSVLDETFYRDQASFLSNTTIVNQEIRRSLTWTVPLMAKTTGVHEIPAISVGAEKSEPLTITINEPKIAPPGEADVFVATEIDQTETYVQAQVLYRIKVYRAVATRQPALIEPSISGAESLFERAGDERAYQALLDGKAYNVVERVIAIYPQESGEIDIPPARFEARVLRNGRITGRKVFESESHKITVLPKPDPPADFPNAAWLPARDLTLQEEWSREPDRIKAGEPVTRHVTLSALGQLETQIPAIEPPDIDGVNVYADKPDLSRRVEAHGIRGVRKDQYAMIGVRGGEVEIPELVIPWWDISVGEWKVARLPGRSLEIEAVIEDVIAEPVEPAAPSVDDGSAVDSETVAATVFGIDGFWKKATQLLSLLWLLTIALWWWSSRERDTVDRAPEPPPIYKQQAKFIKAARKAALANDKSATRDALVEWARLEWPESPPRSVGELASRVAEPMSSELSRLSAISYGAVSDEWSGKTMASKLKSLRRLEDVDLDLQDGILPPLMPPNA